MLDRGAGDNLLESEYIVRYRLSRLLARRHGETTVSLIVLLLFNYVVVIFIFVLLCAGLLKWLSSKLTVKEGFLIALPAHAIQVLVMVVYYTLKAILKIPSPVDGPIVLVGWALPAP